MAQDPAFLFYPSDFLTGVSDLTMEERGQYITLLCLQHQKGRISEKTIRLAIGLASVDVLEKFDIDTNGDYYNSRLAEEIEKRAQFVDSRRINGSKGGRPKVEIKPNGKPLAKPNGKAKNNLPEDVNDNEDIIIESNTIKRKTDFEIFWNLYDKKVGDKGKLIKKWDALTDDEQIKALEHIPLYIKSTPDKKFRKDPQTYLNNKSFNDEIIVATNLVNNTPSQHASSVKLVF